MCRQEYVFKTILQPDGVKVYIYFIHTHILYNVKDISTPCGLIYTHIYTIQEWALFRLKQFFFQINSVNLIKVHRCMKGKYERKKKSEIKSFCFK